MSPTPQDVPPVSNELLKGSVTSPQTSLDVPPVSNESSKESGVLTENGDCMSNPVMVCYASLVLYSLDGLICVQNFILNVFYFQVNAYESGKCMTPKRKRSSSLSETSPGEDDYISSDEERTSLKSRNLELSLENNNFRKRVRLNDQKISELEEQVQKLQKINMRLQEQCLNYMERKSQTGEFQFCCIV